jgi:hypothetical protein
MSAPYEGTLSTTVGTTWSLLQTVTVPGVYTFWVDRANLLSGDVLEVAILEAVKAGGTARLAYYQDFPGAPQTITGTPTMVASVEISVPIRIEHEGKFYVRQPSGVSRNVDWSIRLED